MAFCCHELKGIDDDLSLIVVVLRLLITPFGCFIAPLEIDFIAFFGVVCEQICDVAKRNTTMQFRPGFPLPGLLVRSGMGGRHRQIQHGSAIRRGA